MRHTYSPGATGADRQTFGQMSSRLRQIGDQVRSTMTPEAQEMVKNRRVNARLARTSSLRRATAAGAGGGASSGFSDLQFATGRPRDPLFYWRQNNLPYDFSQNEELAKVRAFCNTPDAPIWMGDYSFKPIGEVQPGDEVIGWTWSQGERLHSRKKLVRTRVLAVARRWAPEVMKITMRSGRVIKCTPDHMWANARFSPAYGGKTMSNGKKWQQPEFIPAVTKAKNARYVHVIDPTSALTDEKQLHAAAWLSGIYDGEGTAERIAQDREYNPAVRERIKEYLDVLGLPHTEDKFCINIRIAGSRGGSGSHQNLVNFLNWADPVRRTSKQIDKRLLNRPSAGYDEVESVEPLGPGWVVSMQTETGNYVAWGFASKNCRLLYQTDPIIGACIDIFSKFPTIGSYLECKDDKLTDFYTEQFFDPDHLDYDEFLVDIGREYFIAGEAWPFATFDEDLGIWSDEELLNPDDIKVERSPFLKEPRYFIRLPWTIRQILQTRQPAWEYNKLIKEYPELSAYTSENSFMPVSSVLLRQLKFKGDTFNVRGLPLLTRAMRACLQQEMLNTALDAIADRLYTPLILCKLGASASDLGTTMPWIPTDDDLENFELALDAALAADFRALVYNFGVDMAPVLGREAMPDLTPDFERIEDRMLMTFGLSRTLLNGAEGGQTYAADALNRDLVTMLMTRYQKFLARHFRARALIVAEAQEHYDYEERNGKRYVIMEEVLETDEETGEKRITEQPKLLVPTLRMRTLNFKDEDTTRQFIEALRASSVPISMRTRTRDLGIDLDEEIERSEDEAVDLAVSEQRSRKRTFSALRDEGLPIAPDLLQDFMPKAQLPGVPPTIAAEQIMQPRIGEQPIPLPNLAPGPEDMTAEEAAMEGGGEPGAEEDGGGFPDDEAAGDEDQRPEESDEQREDMPKKAVRVIRPGPGMGQLFRRTARVRDMVQLMGIEAATQRSEASAVILEEGRIPFEVEAHIEPVFGLSEDGQTVIKETREWQSGPTPACYDTPGHVGIRGKLHVSRTDHDLVAEERYPQRALT